METVRLIDFLPGSLAATLVTAFTTVGVESCGRDAREAAAGES